MSLGRSLPSGLAESPSAVAATRHWPTVAPVEFAVKKKSARSAFSVHTALSVPSSGIFG